MMSIHVWSILMSICMVIGQSQNNDSQLILLQVLFRHGARSPVILYPGDPNPPEVWPEGFGELTQLGKKQHYVLGKYLRSRYSNFITSNPREVLVNSTAYDRCLMSALANLASFYAPTPQWAFDGDFNWQPIPVHYSPILQDKYLSLESDCPRSFEDQHKRFSSKEFLDLIEKYKPLLRVMREHGAFEEWPWALLFQDTVAIEIAHGLLVPSWIEPYWDQLTELSTDLFRFLYDSDLQKRLRGGPIIGKIIENMDDKITGKNTQLKVHMSSFHDANLVVILQALGVYNNIRPPFCATLLFELYQRSSGSKEVRILYLNSTRPEDFTSHVPYVLELAGCSEYCPLEYFRAMTRRVIPEDWDLECRPEDPNFKKPDDAFTKMVRNRLDEHHPSTTSCTNSGYFHEERDLSCSSYNSSP